VTFHISGEDSEMMDLEVQLKEKWDLRDVFLTPGVSNEELKNDLSMAGAQYLEMNLPSEESLIALGWGETISGITRNLGRVIPEKTSFVTLCGGVMHYLSEHTPTNVGTPLSGFLYPFHVIPTPLMVGSPELRDQLLNEHEVQHVMNMAQLADIAMVGIGSLKTSTEFEGFGFKSQKELDLLKKRGAVGEMHGEYFNSVGEPLELEHHHRLISIRLETLRKMKHVVGVAGGPDKIEALQAALKGGFIHSLITDEMTARTLLPSS
ncbi:MAG TPA: deoxyribonucleoside regulator, partial [Candidatus Lambdaproteobacteria bacterium]|nr:deoxyribonucleoside regulator [Candidatus Lambdaproteobacteria bacterium]